ncbi:hypothetical protein BH11PSE10_BH11PSE10_06120 [soil metagenome]
MTVDRETSGLEIAIVGMAGRFPGAPDIAAFWRNLQAGVDSIRRLDLEELIAQGRAADEVRAPEFVPAHGVLDGHDLFDAEFFGYRPREAEGIDPQQRVFLEVAWEALEDAGCDPARYAGSIAVFGGSSANQYLTEQLRSNPAALARIGSFQASFSNQADHLASRVAYKLNLTGPAVAVQSACSTSLVAVHLACQQLLAGACDMALAGGVSITLPRFWGYRYEDGMILSPDGRCRAFDIDAKGCLKGDGAAIVVLKRLSDALADGDRIDAVILGSAANNDGAAKVGYTAPGLDGQARLIATVHAIAGIEPDSIGYVEAHGTGTPLGDPIEIAALTQAFRRGTQRSGFCGIGSVKSNIGHLDAAAGVSGLIKAALALKHATLPASLHLRTPNPRLDLPSTPFEVVDRTRAWPAGATPRRAGVSSFGIGGTNAHAVLEEPPLPSTDSPADGRPHLLLLSARSPQALAQAAARLADHLEANPGLSMADVAHTLALGRHAFVHRRAVVARDAAEAVVALRGAGGSSNQARSSAPSVVFMFPGQGAQYPGMGQGLYQHWPAFRDQVDAACAILQPLLGLDLRRLIFDASGSADAAEQLRQTALTQPALFVVEYALARALIDLGIEPAAMVGHSLGEYVAACLAGVFSLEDALRLVVERGRLMQAQPPGRMLAVPLDAADLRSFLDAGVDLAAENSSGLSVAAGPAEAIDALAARLTTELGIEATQLRTSHAFHSSMMTPAVPPFLDLLNGVPRQPPTRRFASTVTGTWADAEALNNPQHWARNIRDSVRFAGALKTLFTLEDVLLIEVGPGSTLVGLARRHADHPPGLVLASSLRHPGSSGDDLAFFIALLGSLWCAGVEIGSGWLGEGSKRRIALPTYPFQRQCFWIDPAVPSEQPRPGTDPVRDAIFYAPAWRRCAAPAAGKPAEGRWIVVGPPALVDDVVAELLAAGRDARGLAVTSAEEWAAAWALAAEHAPGQLLLIAPVADAALSSAGIPRLIRAIAAAPPDQPLDITLLSSGGAAVLGDERLVPEQELAVGWLHVLPQELPQVRTRVVDIEGFEPAALRAALAEGCTDEGSARLAFRRGRRWQRSLGRLALPAPAAPPALPKRLRPRGVYAISGGLGGMGLALAEYLARVAQARLLLFSRSAFPARTQWADWCATQPADEPTRRTITRLLALEALGAEILVGCADVTDPAALVILRDAAQLRFGGIDGLIHAAGMPGGGLIALQTDERIAEVLAPKVDGTRALLACFAAPRLEWVVLCSSLTSFVPLPGRAEYSAANLWLDAWAQAGEGQRPFTLSINWDNWRETGMARAAGTAAVGLSDAEGVDAFARALDGDEVQLLVAKRDLLVPRSTSAAAPMLSVDRPTQATPSPGTITGDSGASEIDPGMTPDQQRLLGFARDLLGVERLGLHDDFFENGGDSVVSIQLVARARRVGISLSAKQVFEHKTIAAMADAIVAAAPPSTGAPTALATRPAGQLALTPIQRWFFDLPLAHRGHWNLGLTLATPIDADPMLLRESLAAVVERHQALRLRFVRLDGIWRATIDPAPTLSFESLDLSDAADDEALTRGFDGASARAQAAFELESGPLLRAVHVHAGARPGQLFIGVHHLAADLIGLRLLAEELEDAWRQRLANGPALLAARASSWSAWTEHLAALAQRGEADAARAHWARLATIPAAPLPRDFPGGVNRHDSVRRHSVELDQASSAALLAQVGGGAAVADALLAALGTALRDWSGHPHVWIDVEGHGRDSLDDGVDVTRAIGWFTTLHPVVLAAEADRAAAQRQAGEALRQASMQGHGHGLLRYLHRDPAVRSEMAQLPAAEVVFLYQGQRQERADAGAVLPVVGIDADHGHAGADPRSHLFEINAWIADGCLRVDWMYSASIHDEATVHRLALAFERALPSAASPAGEPVAEPARSAPLSFAQQRIWFLQQLEPSAQIYNKQAVIELDGALDLLALERALGTVVARHAALRTRFVLRDGMPVQMIDADALAVLHRVSLTGASDAEAEAAARQRAAQTFDLARASPFDAALLTLGPQRHWLVLTLHHIITDAWSIQVLVGDLALAYRAHSSGTELALEPLPTSFAAYAQWQRQWLTGATLAELLAHWQQRLHGLAMLDLPTDRPRPPVQRFEGGRVHFNWPAALTTALQQLGRSAGATPFMGLLALFKLLLQRYSGQDDIAVGAPAADRPRVETEALVGPLVNNLVLRTDLSGAPDFLTVLSRVRETVLDANEHRDLPFEKLVEALNPPRDRSRSPLFQVMFAYMNVPGAIGDWGAPRAVLREIEAGGAEFDLTLYAYAPGHGAAASIRGWFEYSTALFDRSTIERLSGHLQQLAESACAAPAQRVATLPMLTAAEYRTIIEDWSEHPVTHPAFNGLQQLFEAQVRLHPTAPAAVFDDLSLSYAELDARANRLARHLRALGVAPDDRVAICAERTSAMLVGLLAILKAGGAYVPVDPTYPLDRITHMLTDSGAKIVLTQSRLLDRLPGAAALTLCLDRDAACFESLDPSALPCVTRPDHLAYVIYTSGSTGLPKGVQIEIGSALNFVQAMVGQPGIGAGDTLLAVTTISFDIHVLELFVPLAVGGCVVVASNETAADGGRLRRRLEAGDITVMQATPSTWRMLIDAGWSGTPGLKLLCGGEALAPDLARLLLPRCAQLWNLYGPTEATVWATLARIEDAQAPITIGRPFDNMRAYVLAPQEQPTPVGLPGELCLGGQGVARGYLGRPELTAQRFIADPFVGDARLYRTGDLARWRPDGSIEVLGRLDDQVKLRGHRIELGEVEAAIGSHAAIDKCVCLVREDRPGDQRMVAYTVASGAARPELAELRAWAARTLPEYMLPSALVWMDVFPLTPNGKLNRRALPAPVLAAAAAPAALTLSASERFFADIFAEVLGIGSVGRNDNFFDIGGHSLLLMKVVGLVEQRGGIAMHPGEMFQQTVGQLAVLYGARLPLAAQPVAADDIERIEPVFFDGSAGALYGCHHAPTGATSGLAVLLCPPIAHEYARSHRALRQLAARLARQGIHAFRFDYFGSGDSDGEAAGLSLAQCRDDIAAAVRELRSRSPATRIAVVGLRLGATLAWQSCAGRFDIDAMVLWSPIVDGAALLSEWRADQRDFATAIGLSTRGGTEQVLGHPLPARLVAELEALPLAGGDVGGSRLLLADGVDPRQRADDFLLRAGQASLPSVELITLDHGPIWRQDPLEASVPTAALLAIINWLRAA